MARKGARSVFVTGATGYLGRSLVAELLARGQSVVALVRPGSESRLPSGCRFVRGDPLDAASYAASVAPADTFVHLVGVPKPSPWKAREFERVDLGSALAAIEVARRAQVAHFVYVSVAHPAPVMRAYVGVRARAELALRDFAGATTILRPWYVLGPGHRWPTPLVPVLALLERVPATRDSAQRLGFVTLRDMTAALAASVVDGGSGVRVLEVPRIRELGRTARLAGPERA